MTTPPQNLQRDFFRAVSAKRLNGRAILSCRELHTFRIREISGREGERAHRQKMVPVYRRRLELGLDLFNPCRIGETNERNESRVVTD